MILMEWKWDSCIKVVPVNKVCQEAYGPHATASTQKIVVSVKLGMDETKMVTTV